MLSGGEPDSILSTYQLLEWLMNGETGDVLFGRSVFGGFKRKDVMDYIDKLQRVAAENSGDPDALAQIRCERDALAGENDRLREEIMQLRALLRVEQTANELLDEKLHTEESSAADAGLPAPGDDADPLSVRNTDDSKHLSMRDVDEMVQKYFG